MEKSSKYTLLRTIGRFFSLTYKSLDTWRVLLFYGAVITALTSGFYLVYMCDKRSLQCFISMNAVVILLLIFAGFCYLYDFYQCAFKNTVFKIADVVKFDKPKIKSLCFLAGYFFSFIISGAASWLIIAKPANPDWRIEFIYFTIFFAFCMVPILAMRFSAAPAFYFDNQKMPSLKYLFLQTSGRSYIGIIGFLLVMLLLSLLNLYLYGYGKRIFSALPTSVTFSVLNTFFNTLVMLFTVSVLFCFFEAQRQVMIADDKSDVLTPESAPALKKQPDEKMTKTAKKSKAKKKQK
jgi:hypothetical protein